MKYYDKNPKGGWKEISQQEYLMNQGVTLNPVHNFEMLKEFRLKMFEVERVKFIEERKSKGCKTGEVEINAFYVAWLNSELKTISIWLSDKYPSGELKKIRESTSNQIEILKYENFINCERENIMNPELKGVNAKIKKPCNSMTRARAFCILLLQDAGREAKHIEKKELMLIVKKYFPEQSGKTIYDLIKINGFDLTAKTNPKFKLDFEHGSKLFNELKSK